MATNNSSLDSVFVAALDQVVERRIGELSKACTSRMFSTKRAAAYLGVSYAQFRMMAEAEERKPEGDRLLVSHRYSGTGMHYYDVRDLDKFIEQSRGRDRS